MSKAISSTYSAAHPSGGVAPTVIGPDRGMKEVYLVGGGVLALAIGIGIFWMTTQGDDLRSSGNVEGLRSIPSAPPVAVSTPVVAEPIVRGGLAASVQPALPTQLQDVRHADVYFDFGRKGLSDEAKAYLTAHAAFLRNEPDWGVIIQGSTDGRGSAIYNKKLGQQRADEVRAFLGSLGIPDTSMKAVSVGKDGALCQDSSQDCQQLNRRVHLEFVKVGAVHMAPPMPPMSMDAAVPTSDASGTTVEATSSEQAEAPINATINAPINAIDSTTSMQSESLPGESLGIAGADGTVGATETSPSTADLSDSGTADQHP